MSDTERLPEVMRIGIRGDGMDPSSWRVYDLDTMRLLPVTYLRMTAGPGDVALATVEVVVSKLAYEGSAQVAFAGSMDEFAEAQAAKP